MNTQTAPDFPTKELFSGTFPFRKTEGALTSFARKPVSQQTDTEYRELLKVFISEYSDIALSESPSENLSSSILDYLTEENQQDRLVWYHTLIHQYAYYFKYSRFDTSDINYITLTNILNYPEEYVDVQSNKYVFSK